MRSNYKRLGQYIRHIDVRNKEDNRTNLLGVSVTKVFIDSIANTVGTDFTKYKIVKKNQFTYIPDTSRRGDKIGIALLEDRNEALVSQAYTVFEVVDIEQLLPQYLMMWFRRTEFDRYARFISHGSVREIFSWDDMCNLELPVPSIEKQREIVKEYKVIQDRISLNNTIIEKLEDTARTIYKQWFVDFEFPDENGKPYKSNGGELEFNEELDNEVPKGWKVGSISDYSNVKSGYAFKSKWWHSSGIPVIKIGSLQNNTISYNLVDFVNQDKLKLASNYLVKKGDIVIAMTGATIGKIAIVPDLNPNILVNQRVGMFDLGTEPLNRAPFLYCSLLQDYVINEIKNAGGDSAQANISNTEIGKIILLIPEFVRINEFNIVVRPMLESILTKIQENIMLEEITNILLAKLSTVEG